MRKLALVVLAIFSFLSAGCDVKLQPALQGEWANVHNDKDKVSKDARPHEEKPEAK
ncbi:MAG TPA: hypothetical protein VEU96_32690 [Bryobacteraceae bacterium]|nr:hypothetical protein [Bryobacteraceae bacterium]